MSFNFSQLQQSVDRLLINSSEAINKFVDLSIAPAKDVTVQYYDKNGNLVTQTTPNMMKVLDTVQTNINSYMQKTVYVDQVKGNDNNDGTQARPFKTLRKAFDSVPVGGFVNIYLLSDYTFTGSHEHLNRRHCRIYLNGYTLSADIDSSQSTARIIGILLEAAYLRVSGPGKILIPSNSSGKPIDNFNNSLFLCESSRFFAFVELNFHTFVNNACEILSGNLLGVSSTTPHNNCLLHFNIINAGNNNFVVDINKGARLINTYGATLFTNLELSGKLKDSQGNNLSLTDVISGLSYYTVSTPNGTRLIPRNYVGRNDLSRAP